MRRSLALRRRIGLLAAFIPWLAAAPLLAQTAGAILQGRVLDQDGRAIPGVTLTAAQTGTGLKRVTSTASDGTYRFPNLPVGSFTVTAEISGFKTVETQDVVLNVASTRDLNVSMKLADVKETITVTSEIPVVRAEPSIGAVVSEKELENLPLNGRQFANLGVLAPGTSLAYNSDPTKPGQLTVALNGGIGRNVNYVVDGGDNTDDTIGGALQNYSIEGVQEFNIQTQQYKAEYGRSTGGVLSVVTKTGTNDIHGSAFGFFRDEALNAVTHTEEAAGLDAQPYSRKQFGGSLGGPIAKDKAHFFGTYERTKRDTEYVIDSGGLFPTFDGSAVTLPFKDDLFTGKVTGNLSPTQFVQVRYGYQKNTDKYGASPGALPDSLGTITNKYHSILAGHQWQFGSGAINEATFQYSKFDNIISADSTNPTLLFPNGVHSGQSVNAPQSTHQVKYQFKDDYSFSHTLGGKRHDFKAGFNVIHEPTLGGDFSTGVDAPQYTLLENRIDSPVTLIQQFGGFFTDQTPVNQYSLYFQDDWRASDRLTVNAGLRYDYWTGFDLDQTGNPIWQTLSTQTTFNEGYLQDFQGGKAGVLENDKNNWGPRVGFSYDLKGDSKQFLRGGFGIYYDFPYTNATILFPSAAVQSDYGVAYEVGSGTGILNPDGSLFHVGQPLPPNGLQNTNVNPPNEVASPTLRTPFSRQFSIGYSTELTHWLGATMEVVSVDYRDIPFRFRANPRVNGGARRFSDFGNFRIWYGKGRADYDGFNLGLRAHMSHKLTMQGFYTLSRIRGNVLAGADEFRLSDVGYQPSLAVGRDVSVNPLDPLCSACIGPLNTDARHRFTLSGTYTLVHDINLSGMLRVKSATPINIFTGIDTNGDGFVVELPQGIDHVNAGRGKVFSQLDLRVSKRFNLSGAVGIEGLFEVFNLFNAENPTGFDGNCHCNATNSDFRGDASSFSGDPLQGEQRLAQVGLRFIF